MSEKILNFVASLSLAPFLILAFLLTLFLYFRAGRRDLVDREILFDFASIFFVSGLLAGRIFDYVLRPQYYGWSIRKLFFFNVYNGFDIWGALIGGIFIGVVFLKRIKQPRCWQILDFAAAPFALGASIVSIGLLFKTRELIYLLFFAGLFIIFWILKRLEKVKRHYGFFINLFVVCISLLNLALFTFKESRFLYEDIPYDFVISLIFLASFTVNWYILSKRQLRADLKGMVASFLLLLFKTKRIITSIGEADNLARSIILSPYYLSKGIYFLVSLIGREIYASFLDLKTALGLRK